MSLINEALKKAEKARQEEADSQQQQPVQPVVPASPPPPSTAPQASASSGGGNGKLIFGIVALVLVPILIAVVFVLSPGRNETADEMPSTAAAAPAVTPTIEAPANRESTSPPAPAPAPSAPEKSEQATASQAQSEPVAIAEAPAPAPEPEPVMPIEAAPVPTPVPDTSETDAKIARLEALLAQATELAEKRVTDVAEAAASTATADEEDTTDAKPPAPIKKQVNPIAVSFVEGLKVEAIRFSGDQAKAMVSNSRFECQDVIRVNDVIHEETGLKVVSIKAKEIVFTDRGKVTYIKKF